MREKFHLVKRACTNNRLFSDTRSVIIWSTTRRRNKIERERERGELGVARWLTRSPATKSRLSVSG